MNIVSALLFIVLGNLIKLDTCVGQSSPNTDDQRLFLTPLIESNQIDHAKQLSRVTGLPTAPASSNEHLDDVISYSGYLTVNKTFNSNIFFWFFPALDKNVSAPTLLWLQGGPGSSSMFGILIENGPIRAVTNVTAARANITWAQNFNMLYIDQPVGTGFSFTDNELGFANNEDDVARDLYNALQQFFTLFSEYRYNDLYLTGESYAGKYIPALGFKIHSEGDSANLNLKGFAIGDGTVDPINQLTYGDYLFHIGLITEPQRAHIKAMIAQIKEHVRNLEFVEAKTIRGQLLDSITDFTGLQSVYNYREDVIPDFFFNYATYVQIASRQLHVGDQTFTEGGDPADHLNADVMQSIKDKLIVLMNEPKYKILFFFGQLDIIDNYSNGRNVLWKLNWTNCELYHQADQIVWNVDNGIAGWVRQVTGFTEVLIRDASHMVAIDKPAQAFDMITRFVNDLPFN